MCSDASVFGASLSYNPETGVIVWIKSHGNRAEVGDIAGTPSNGYVSIGFGGKQYRAHRIAWLLHYGSWPTGMIDHINGIRDDNRIANLRDVTNRVNSQNHQCHRDGHLVGTHFHQAKQKWTASIQIDGEAFKLGTFNTEIEAHNAYLAALRDPNCIPPNMDEIREATGRLRGCKFDKRRNKWVARYHYDNTERYLGQFDTQEEAHAAWSKAQDEPPPAVESQAEKFVSGKTKGYSFSKVANRWTSSIYINKERFHLGYFDTPEEAAAAYAKALQEKPAKCETLDERIANGKVKGYCWCKSMHKWMASMRVNGKRVYLGYYEKEEDARNAYLNAVNSKAN
jgi:hypothetical protein